MDMLHLSSVKKMMASGETVTLKVLTAKGELKTYPDCVSLKYNHRAGCRNIKLLASGQVRKIKDILIMECNGYEVYY